MRRKHSKRSALWGRGGGARIQAALAVTAAVVVAAANGEFLFAWLANWTW